MKKVSLLSISLLIAGNACAMDAEEPAEQPHSPRTSFLRTQLKDGFSIGHPIISAALQKEQVDRLSESFSNLKSNKIDTEAFKAAADEVGENMLVHNQEKQLSEYLKDAQNNKRWLLEKIQSKVEAGIVAEEEKMKQAKEELLKVYSSNFGRNAFVPEAYDTIKHNIAFHHECREKLQQQLAQLKAWNT